MILIPTIAGFISFGELRQKVQQTCEAVQEQGVAIKELKSDVSELKEKSYGYRGIQLEMKRGV